MSRIEIRAATNADIPTLRALQESSMRVLGRGYYSAAQIEAFIARIGTMDDYLVSDRTYLVAELDGELLGCGGWTTRLPGYARQAGSRVHAIDPQRATVRSVFVAPLAARQGVGRRVMSAVEETLQEAGFRFAELGATESGLDFYRRLGYLPLSPFQVDLGEGITLPLTRMGKSLVLAAVDSSAAGHSCRDERLRSY